jgi:hypothetical protein
VTRDAIIHEFSQGSSGSSEWIEILVLRNANLRYWDLEDNAGNLLLFQDTAVWENIPAGTRIVIYNGTVGVPKDPILPADDTDPSDRRMVLSSANATYFDPTFDPWLPLANGGDGIYLVDEAGNAVSEVGYGNDTLAAINVGAVGSGKAAYYSGDSDEGSNVAGNWTTTTSLSARSFKVTRAAGDLFISEYVEGSGNNKALEIYNPSSSAVDLTAAGYKVEIYYNGSSVAGATLNMTGTLAAGGTFVLKNNASTGVISTVSAQISNLNVNFSGDDAVLLKKGSVTVDCFGQVGNDPGTAWTALGGYSTADKTLRRKSSILQGDTDSSNAFDPSIEWDLFATDTISGLGSHTVGSPSPSLAVSINPASFAETAGASAATGTVTVSQAPTTNLTVTLASLDPTELTVPATVTILANQTTATFAVAAVDDALSDGTQSVVINASASGYTQGSATVSVTDNEVSLVGVTPGAANTPANATWIASLAAGTAGSPALFRLGTGSTLPAGLTFDANTGLISGTIGTSASGSYSVIIERYNSAGEVVSQSFTLNITAATGYLGWVGGYNTLSDSAATADPDKDGFANVIEYYLGLNPGIHDSAGVIITGKTPTSLSLTYRRPKGTTGLTPVVECSASLAAGSWSSNGISEQLLEDNPGDQLVKATLVISEADPRKFIRLRVTLSP